MAKKKDVIGVSATSKNYDYTEVIQRQSEAVYENNPSTLKLVGPIDNVTVTQGNEINIDASKAFKNAQEYRVTSNPPLTTINMETGVITGTANDPVGTYNVSVTGYDYNRYKKSVNFTVTIEEAPEPAQTETSSTNDTTTQ